ncbi:MAG: indolepyruvate ferredoxin oxidoreductase family protein [Acidimicrobiaceae bacterium]|nr:indolepyruvate ferredoxin oxidoreductase family protein [Acidimicrobiaceae bacterium]MYE96157.1 indolepyruvate ferredoxin oxidoreductase family protein [Acidimicrobiaceae bacterium]MYI53213.1 indolepyruvate ferredoxin oxidoreductase family protein [Acidimicrobiaceae bacterium]
MSLEPSELSTLQDFDLDQKFTLERGRVLLTGIQAVVRLPIDQHRADAARGLRTATFISGYQGSPLGTVDLTIERNLDMLTAHDVVWVPGVNEELAATAVWGSQEPLLGPLARHDGVVGMWYGKGPGVDRCGDVFKHGNFKGTAPNGGVLVLAGDDPMAKSSTLPTQVEPAFYDAQIPILYPGSMQEVIDLGLHGIALSRYSGLWVAFKVVTTVAGGFGIAEVAPDRIVPVDPELEIDGKPWHHVQRPGLVTPLSLEQEKDIVYGRLEAAAAYAAANGLNEISGATGAARLGIAAAGRTFGELRQALSDLGLDDDALHRFGIRLLRIGMVWPLEPGIVRRFAAGLNEILVLDEKRAFIELFVRDILYGRAGAPRVVGKTDEQGRRLVPADGELSADRIAVAVADRLRSGVLGGGVGALPMAMEARLALIEAASKAGAAVLSRAPYWCSGCPHNRSTAVPEGSFAAAGVGCHAMALWIDDRAQVVHQMGGEGATWIGRAPFTDRTHMFQNVGDGTFFHSASLAVRAAVAAGVDITYKILYNGAVAMTGGQDVAGAIGVPELTQSMAAEGVSRTIVCSDDPDRHAGGGPLAPGAEVWGRDRLDEAQIALRDTPGVTVLIYDQQCAATKRRERKRGLRPTPTKRIFINEAVCEGCGDCGAKSHCLSVQPVDTELGTKTRIHQSSCNFDYTCIEGDCPSFIRVKTRPAKTGPAGAKTPPAGAARTMRAQPPADIAEPDRPVPGPDGYGVFMAGVGGTGVVTVSQVLATAALLDGLDILGLDQTGLSQKGGPVVSHLRFFGGVASGANLIGAGDADCYLGLDLLVAADPKNLAKADPERTLAVTSTSKLPTGHMVAHVDETYPEIDGMLAAIDGATRASASIRLDADRMADALLGTAMPANVLALGAAYQAGGIPVSAASIEEAIKLNGVAVAANIAAFRWGRVYVREGADGLVSLAGVSPAAALPETAAAAPGLGLDSVPARAKATARALLQRSGLATVPTDGAAALAEMVERRAADLADYQSASLASEYVDFVDAASAREREVMGERTELAEAVARYLHKLIAYKDEYEVARLHLRPGLHEAMRDAVGDYAGYRILLHPPALRALGLKRKISLGPLQRPALAVLKAMRRLRGTPLDLFGYAKVRRVERQLVADYRALLEAELNSLTPGTYERAVKLAQLPDVIRGYEDVKLAGVERFGEQVRAVRSPDTRPVALTTKPAG